MSNFIGMNNLNQHVENTPYPDNSQDDTQPFIYAQRWSQTQTQHVPSQLNLLNNSSQFPPHHTSRNLHPSPDTWDPQAPGNAIHELHNQGSSEEYYESSMSMQETSIRFGSAGLAFQQFQPQFPRSISTLLPRQHVPYVQKGDQVAEHSFQPGPSSAATKYSTYHYASTSGPPPLWQSFNNNSEELGRFFNIQDNIPHILSTQEPPRSSGNGAHMGDLPFNWQGTESGSTMRAKYPLNSYQLGGEDAVYHHLPLPTMEEQRIDFKYQRGTTGGTAYSGAFGTRSQYTAHDNTPDLHMGPTNLCEGTVKHYSPTSSNSKSLAVQNTSTLTEVNSLNVGSTSTFITLATRDPFVNLPPLEERLTGEEFHCKWFNCSARFVKLRQAGETDDAGAQTRLQISVHEHLQEHARLSDVCLWERCMKSAKAKRGRVGRSLQGTLEIPLDLRRTFGEARNLRRHIFSCHLDVKFECGRGACVQVFSRESALRRHQGACTGEPKSAKGKKRVRM
ncbi:hypothetical protein BDZ94DRAFT_1312030 [Collybia nuda]|uniref:C2H2-type domain-containing protein n=1 Tax=Collybia nuda TaxID=64659 RepID=A0A9P5XZF0_9AGAR|nr:hypothetical protein BDZ94DRAFT_1312030 [Collybia nuda]